MSETTTPPPLERVAPAVDTQDPLDTVDPKQELAQRQEGLLPIVNEIIPPRTDRQIIDEVICRAGSGYNDLPEEDKRRLIMRDASYVKRHENDDSLAKSLAVRDIPPEEARLWLTTAHEAASLVSVEAFGIARGTVGRILNLAGSYDELLQTRDLLGHWTGAVMQDVAPDRALKLKDVALGLLDELHKPTEGQKRSDEEVRALFLGSAEIYQVVEQGPRNEQGRSVFEYLIGALERTGRKEHSAEPLRAGTELLKAVVNLPDHLAAIRLTNAVGIYIEHYPLTTSTVRGWRNKLLPAMQRREPQVEVLIKVGAAFGVGEGTFGVADLIVHAYGSEVSPSNINQLLMMCREVPTTDLARLEQNRSDALDLAANFRILRDFIHDQQTGVHDMIVAMLGYYADGDPASLIAAMDKSDYFKSEEYRQAILDRSNYESSVNGDGELGVDVLRRLEENTRPFEIKAPEVSDPILYGLLKRIEVAPADKQALEQALKHINTKLIEQMRAGEVGIEPKDIEAISWLERRCFDKLQDLTYEDQMDAYKLPWFKEVMLFQELTASEKFDEQEFGEFMARLSKMDSENAYKAVADRTLRHIQALSKRYTEKGWGSKVGALWSGNTAHELIGLVDARSAITAVGAKLKDERSLPFEQRYRGD